MLGVTPSASVFLERTTSGVGECRNDRARLASDLEGITALAGDPPKFSCLVARHRERH